MFTWAQIIVIILSIFACVITVAICDITIIKEIRRLIKLIKELTLKGN